MRARLALLSILPVLITGTGMLSTMTSAQTTPGSEPPPQEPERAAILEAARDIIDGAGYAALVTLDAEGHPQARAMDPFAPGTGLVVWMGTSRTTRKVEQLRRDSRATLYYFDPGGPGYVTLLGTVEIVEDPEERRDRWKPEWSEYYPAGPDGDTYLLLRFVPHRLEIVSPEHGIADEPLAWRPRILELDLEAGGR